MESNNTEHSNSNSLDNSSSNEDDATDLVSDEDHEI